MYLKSIRKWFTLPAKFEIQLMGNWIMKRVSCSKSLLTTADVFFSLLSVDRRITSFTCLMFQMKDERRNINNLIAQIASFTCWTNYARFFTPIEIVRTFVSSSVMCKWIMQSTRMQSLRTSILNVYTMILSLLCNYFIEIIFASHRLRLCAPSFNNIIHWRLCACIA